MIHNKQTQVVILLLKASFLLNITLARKEINGIDGAKTAEKVGANVYK